jgi:hypothetical protein
MLQVVFLPAPLSGCILAAESREATYVQALISRPPTRATLKRSAKPPLKLRTRSMKAEFALLMLYMDICRALVCALQDGEKSRLQLFY